MAHVLARCVSIYGMNDEIKNSAQQLRAAIGRATDGLVGREQLAELMVLAAVAGEHLLVIGPPGTGKSAVVRRVAQAMGGRYFEYLLGRFTEPSELFGAVDLKKLREGTVETDVTGMLPQADIAFLDEVFLGSTAILNTLLGVLNERQFRRGHTDLACPLRICVGAANALPEDPSLAAFGDRFVLHLFIDPLADFQLEAMLSAGWQGGQQRVQSDQSLQHLDLLSQALRHVSLDAVRPALVLALRQLRSKGIELSDRRIVKSQSLIAAAALLSGRTQASTADLWPLLYVIPTKETQQSAREVLKDVLEHSTSVNLMSAVEEATQQPLSRVTRLVANAHSVLALPTQDAQRQAKIEAVLREIDANFAAPNLPDALVGVRTRLIGTLAEVA